MQANSKETSTRLIAFAVSHYCEKARWALERLSIPFIEEPHVPGFHWLFTLPAGGKSVPVLLTEAGAFTDSTDILHYLDTLAPTSHRLYPTDAELRREVETLEDLFDTVLGVAVRCWIYFYLLNSYELMQKLWCQGVPPIESTLFPVVFPPVRSFVRKDYNITAQSAASSLNQIRGLFEQVNKRLADGRSYLVGNCFSAADLSFACLAAPILIPPEYGGKALDLPEFPNEMALVHQELRETPAGTFVLRLFGEERRTQLSLMEFLG
ncbi:MAG TPA: glutathione S-transferase family protein [Chroococcales cyanobacterium]|jgi:glutathione S-transferase